MNCSITPCQEALRTSAGAGAELVVGESVTDRGAIVSTPCPAAGRFTAPGQGGVL